MQILVVWLGDPARENSSGQRNPKRTSRFGQVLEFRWAFLSLGCVRLDHGCC